MSTRVAAVGYQHALLDASFPQHATRAVEIACAHVLRQWISRGQITRNHGTTWEGFPLAGFLSKNTTDRSCMKHVFLERAQTQQRNVSSSKTSLNTSDARLQESCARGCNTVTVCSHKIHMQPFGKRFFELVSVSVPSWNRYHCH